MNNKFKSVRKKKLRIFDEIEAKDYLIYKNNSQIKKIKADSIKQLIYTNHPVPKKWRSKKNYQNQVYEIFSRNPNFLLIILQQNFLKKEKRKIIIILKMTKGKKI